VAGDVLVDLGGHIVGERSAQACSPADMTDRGRRA
jgi:hypothetical protein